MKTRLIALHPGHRYVVLVDKVAGMFIDVPIESPGPTLLEVRDDAELLYRRLDDSACEPGGGDDPDVSAGLKFEEEEDLPF